MENKELYHYGVLGMKWGRRTARIDARRSENKARFFKKIGLKKLGDAWERDAAKYRKKEEDLENEIQAQKAHKDKVKVLKQQVKANKSKRADAQWDKMNSDAARVGKSIDKLRDKKMSDINKSNISRTSKLLSKLHLNQTIQKMHEANIYKVEEEYISARRRDKSGWRKKADEVTQNWAKGVDDRWRNETRGKNLFDAIKISMKIDREESRRLVENLLEAEANFYD